MLERPSRSDKADAREASCCVTPYPFTLTSSQSGGVQKWAARLHIVKKQRSLPAPHVMQPITRKSRYLVHFFPFFSSDPIILVRVITEYPGPLSSESPCRKENTKPTCVLLVLQDFHFFILTFEFMVSLCNTIVQYTKQCDCGTEDWHKEKIIISSQQVAQHFSTY